MFYRITIPLAGRSVEDLCERLAEFEVAGIEEREDALDVFFLDATEAERPTRELGGSMPETMADRNWSAEWQEEWRPVSIGERFFLCPVWMPEAATPPGRIRLEMLPGNVFGGGDHPTTQLCLELLERVAGPGLFVADIGAGTGILTRAARSLGARAVGCDIDPASRDFIDFGGSADALADGVADIVVANIDLGVLRELRADFERIGKPNAVFILSGFLADQTEEFVGLFGEPLTLLERDGWCAALVRCR